MEASEKILSTLEFDAVRKIVERYCASSLGKQVTARLIPFASFERACRALAQIEEMRDYLTEVGNLPLQGAHDAVTVLQSARENNKSIDPSDLAKVADLLTCGRLLKSSLEERIEGLRELKSLLVKIADLDDLEAELKRTVDAKGHVLSSASPRLSTIRGEMEKLGDRIRRAAEAFLSSREVSRYLQDLHVSIRNGRRVLPVRTECRQFVKGILHGYSSSGQTAFIEPQSLVEKQNALELERLHETREIARILWERTKRLIKEFEEIRATQRTVAWLDFTQARARYALEYGLIQPELTREAVLILREARHPLLLDMAFSRIEGEEKRTRAQAEVVPVQLHLGDRFDILVVTGPNTGGKTVTLKTAGLLSIMAASGLPVPASQGTVIPFFNAILADIGDEQDLSQNLSTFSSHMQRIGEIIEKADPLSLVLMDELGTGTDPLEGEALGRAILNYLVETKANVLVSTHLSKLKEFAFSSPRVENACMEFNPDTLKPTFRLSIGIPGESNAIHIARRLGIPAAILEEAEAALKMKDGRLKELMDDVQRIRIESEQTLEQSQKEAIEVQRLKGETEAREKEIALRMSVLEQEAEREIDDCLKKGRDRAAALVARLRSLPAPHRESVEALERVLAEMVERSPLGIKRRSYVEGLRKGDLVYIPRYRERCTVIRLHKKEETVEVAYRNLSVKVPFDEVMWPHWY